MRSGVKRSAFRNCWWVAPALGIVAVASLWPATADHGTLVVSVIAIVLSVIFFVQQQKLAEMQLFKQLIVEFNHRYDRLNDKLQRVARSGVSSDEDRFAVFDYFNLCAEEYLFFEEGYIDERVWKSWSNGMRFYFSVPAVADLWDLESKSDSYYGFAPPSMDK